MPCSSLSTMSFPRHVQPWEPCTKSTMRRITFSTLPTVMRVSMARSDEHREETDFMSVYEEINF